MRKIKAKLHQAGEYLDIYDDGCIGRPALNMSPSDSWRITGAVEYTNFGTVKRFYSLQEVLTEYLDWKFRNGKQRIFLRDIDHGTAREMRSPGYVVYLVPEAI